MTSARHSLGSQKSGKGGVGDIPTGILNASIVAALGKTTDRETRAHLEGARGQIAKILDPKFAPATAGTGTVVRIGLDGLDPLAGIPGSNQNCWPDYLIPPY